MRYNLWMFLAVLGMSSPAFAHAHVESSSPAKNEELKSSPAAVKITFSEALRGDESYVKLFDKTGKQVSSEKPLISDDNITLTENLPELTPGKYTVQWKAVCLCTDHHATKGNYNFTIN